MSNTQAHHDTPARQRSNAAPSAHRAPWLARRLARTVLRFSSYPGRRFVGAPRRWQARERGGHRFTVRTNDGVTLDAWFSPAHPASRNGEVHATPRLPVFMLHGWIEVKEFHFARAWQLNRQGHDVVLFDHRAHGRSGGRFATFGVREREDLRRVIDTAVSEKLVPDGRVITLGYSMGAATALQHAAEDERVAGVVAFAPFVNLREAVRSFRIMLAPWIDDQWLQRGFEAASRQDADFDMDEATTLEAMRRLRQPVLLIEGQRDANLPPRWHTQKLAEVKHHGPLEVVTIDRATHCSLCHRAWPGLSERIAKFCAQLG